MLRQAALVGLATALVGAGVVGAAGGAGAELSRSGAGPKTIWVSPHGKDSGAGSKSSPYRTLEKARDAARAVNSSQGQDIVIVLRGGTYRLERPLTLGAEDSGSKGNMTIYRSAEGERAVISGAKEVPGNAWSLQEPGSNIWRAQVGHQESRQLYVNGQRATRAQSTDFPVGFLPHWTPDGVGSGIQYQVTGLNPVSWGDPTSWTNVKDIEAVIDTQWKTMSVPLAGVTAPAAGGVGLLSMVQPAWNNANVFFEKATNAPGIWSFWQVTRFVNAYQFLDAPGEWYLDRAAGDLYYIPRAGEDMKTAQVELPRLETLVAGTGTAKQPVKNLGFENLTFTGATWLGPMDRTATCRTRAPLP